jgi:hypothetical protein
MNADNLPLTLLSSSRVRGNFKGLFSEYFQKRYHRIG